MEKNKIVDAYIQSLDTCSETKNAYETINDEWFCDVSKPGEEIQVKEGKSISWNNKCDNRIHNGFDNESNHGFIDSSNLQDNSSLAKAAVAYACEIKEMGMNNDGTKLYCAVLNSVFPGDGIYQSCDLSTICFIDLNLLIVFTFILALG